MGHPSDELDSTEVSAGCRHSPPLILCIDDDPEIARIWQMRLSRHGVDVASATNGDDGFAAAIERRPDLILLDLCLPGADGNQVLTRLRCHPRTREIPVLMLTGSDASSARRGASAYHADAYLTKPPNFADFRQKLAKYLPIR